MSKMKVHELAKEYNVQSKDIINYLADKGIEKKAGSNVEDNELGMIKDKFEKKASDHNKANVAPAKEQAEKTTADSEAAVIRRPVSVDGRPISADGRKVILPDARKTTSQDRRPVSQDRRPATSQERHPITGKDGKTLAPQDRRPVAGRDGKPLAPQDRRPMNARDGKTYNSQDGRVRTSQDQRPQTRTDGATASQGERRPSSSYVADGYKGSGERRPSSSYVANGYHSNNMDKTGNEKVEIPQNKKPSASFRFDQPTSTVSAPPVKKEPIKEAVKEPAAESVKEQNQTAVQEPVPAVVLEEKKTVTLNKMGNVYENMRNKAAEAAKNNEKKPVQSNERRPYSGNQGQSGERRPYNGGQSYNNGENRPYSGNQGQNGERRPYSGGQGQNGERRPYTGTQGQNGERRPYSGGQGQNGERRPYSGGQGYNNGERRPYTGGQGQSGERRPYTGGQGQSGERRPYSGGQGQNGERRPYSGGQGQNGERRPYSGGQGSYGNRGGAPFNKDGFDKDKDATTFQRPRRNDPKAGEKSTIKSELGKEISKEQRAAAFNDRSRDKNRDRGRMNESDDKSRNGKNKKDPNRKGAFIMPKPLIKDAELEDDIKSIFLPDTLTIKELADKMKKVPSAIVKKLFLEGKMVSINQEISFEEAEEIALGYDCIAEHEVKVNVVEELMKEDEDDAVTLVKRPPVVCVMGHVDHGKTSLLDAIRETNVTAREAGGITQHIGAYVVEIKGEKITFLDTPGHEAFTSMRMRGAKSTDIAILVVAADDGVMPQTIEAINHAKAAEIPIIVAINKIDKPNANIERVKQELTEQGLVAEDWGGDTIFVPLSAKTKEGIEKLLEMILLTAEVGELKANPNRKARGIVIEAELDKGRGPVATILVQKGTLIVGDNVVIGSSFGKVRAMMDDKGKRVKSATPSTPVEILGLNEVPGAGDIFIATDNEKEARTISSAFISQGKERLIADTKAKLSLDGLFSQIKAGNIKELNLIIKADVQGSVEAMKQSLLKLSNEEVAVRIIHGGVGAINESDVNLASASNAIIIGFNVKPDNTAKDIAEHEKVDVKLYRVIYNAIDDVEAAMKGMLDPVFEEKVIAHAEIRQVFTASGLGSIAGSFVLDGKIQRNSSARITREGVQIFEGPVASLKRMKDDVKEVAAGYECGIVFEKFNNLQEFDLIEFYIMVEVPR